MDSGALREAIWDLFAADAGTGGVYDAVAGRMAYERLPTTLPAIRYTFVSGVQERTFPDKFGRVRVSFACFVEGDQADIDAMSTKLRALYDDATLTYAGAELSHVSVDRVGWFGPHWLPDESGTGGVWRDVTDYMVFAKEA